MDISVEILVICVSQSHHNMSALTVYPWSVNLWHVGNLGLGIPMVIQSTVVTICQAVSVSGAPRVITGGEGGR